MTRLYFKTHKFIIEGIIITPDYHKKLIKGELTDRLEVVMRDATTVKVKKISLEEKKELEKWLNINIELNHIDDL